jgi:6-phosphogluconolactonase
MKKISVFLFAFSAALRLQAQTNHKLIVGTYTDKGNSEGIYIYDFDSKTADTKPISVIKNVSNPSYLTLSTNGDIIYSVNESGKLSAASAFKLDKNSGQGTLLNTEATKGANPCFILTDGKHVFTADYSGGSISVFGLKADGSLTALKQYIQHTGKGPDPRQASAHVHQVQFSPDKRYIIANDLGEDNIYIYHYQPDAKTPLTLKQYIKTNAGTGPRHLTFSPNGKYVYLAHEFNGSISVYGYNDGNLTLIQEVPTVAKDFKGKIDGADIHISADGKFLYESNRGDINAIAVFAVAKNGKLTPVKTVSTLGKGPRNFTIDPSGNYLLVAHQYTNDVVIFNRNANTGKLSDSGKRINVGAPVCLVFDK